MLAFVGEVLLGFGVGYIFGAFPTGYFLGWLYGVDVRRHGSGRTGGSNVLRTVGWGAFSLTVLGDMLKGILPLLLVMHRLAPSSATAAASALLGVLVGSNWSIVIAWLVRNDPNLRSPSNIYEAIKDFFARAKAGAGVMATAGAAVTLYWPTVVPLTITGIMVLILLKYSSAASMTVAALYPLVMAYFVLTGEAPAIYLPMSIIVAAIVLYALIPNMKRLRAGTEQKFGQRLPTK
jgi:glycerol-3-phosphate acyltransferase PlsY